MKKLFLIRHAKTEDFGKKIDFERNLTIEGMKSFESTVIANDTELSSIEEIHHSSANRTTQTCNILLKGINEIPVIAKDSLYNASQYELLKDIATINTSESVAAIIAHNPGISGLASYLANERYNFRPGDMMSIKFDCDHWEECGEGNVVLANKIDCRK